MCTYKLRRSTCAASVFFRSRHAVLALSLLRLLRRIFIAFSVSWSNLYTLYEHVRGKLDSSGALVHWKMDRNAVATCNSSYCNCQRCSN